MKDYKISSIPNIYKIKHQSSDIKLFFCGEEKEVKNFVNELNFYEEKYRPVKFIISLLTEISFSHNSENDFRNNLIKYTNVSLFCEYLKEDIGTFCEWYFNNPDESLEGFPEEAFVLKTFNEFKDYYISYYKELYTDELGVLEKDYDIITSAIDKYYNLEKIFNDYKEYENIYKSIGFEKFYISEWLINFSLYWDEYYYKDYNQKIVTSLDYVDFNEIVDSIYEFNEARGTLSYEVDIKRITTYVLEELLEMYHIEENPKELARKLVKELPYFQHPKKDDKSNIIDSEVDGVIFYLGDLMINYFRFNSMNITKEDIIKLIYKAFDTVTKANLKKSMKKDSEGKILKGDEFVPPKVPILKEEL